VSVNVPPGKAGRLSPAHQALITLLAEAAVDQLLSASNVETTGSENPEANSLHESMER